MVGRMCFDGYQCLPPLSQFLIDLFINKKDEKITTLKATKKDVESEEINGDVERDEKQRRRKRQKRRGKRRKNDDVENDKKRMTSKATKNYPVLNKLDFYLAYDTSAHRQLSPSLSLTIRHRA